LPSEAKLAEQFAISRSSVREALRALEILGVIESRMGVGSFVRGLPTTSVLTPLDELLEGGTPLEIVECRKAVEPGIARLAARRRDEEDLRALRDSLDQMERQIGEPEAALEVDLGFHLLLAKACNNPVLLDCMRIIADRMHNRFWRVVKGETLHDARRSLQYLEHHRKILEAIENRDGPGAQRAVSEHLEAVERGLEQGD
jgi:DNA-binding FadR family transcriptional regulator